MNISDFSDSELCLVRQALEERYGEPHEIELADAEVCVNPEQRKLTLCPIYSLAGYGERCDLYSIQAR